VLARNPSIVPLGEDQKDCGKTYELALGKAEFFVTIHIELTSVNAIQMWLKVWIPLTYREKEEFTN